MKSLFVGLALLCLSLTSNVVQAKAIFPPPDATPLLMYLTPENADAFSVQLANLQQAATTLALEDIYGNVYFKKAIRNHNGYRIKVDVKDIPSGRYILRASQDGVAVNTVLYIQSHQILISKGVRS